jgi:class 3 adenylate cyclase
MGVVLENTCGGVVTYTVSGSTVQYLGEGDLHNATHGNYEQASSFERMKELWLARSDPSGRTGTTVDNYFESESRDGVCMYSIRVYPSDDFAAQFYTYRPAVYAVSVALVFSFCVSCLYIYNLLVERRQNKVMTQAVEASSIVDSMFPSAFRDRLFRNRRGVEDATGFFAKVAPPKIRLTTMLSSTVANSDERNSRSRGSYSLSVLNRLEEPIAEVFSSTTVIFADIAGFTAWSSEREPSQVFELLETLYRNFDIVAKRLGVFKVETIGDCYVAVTGLPEFNNDHAVICARFAWEVLHQMSNLTKTLEVSLGPGTSDLSLRIGLHSGSVTAGVLRGDKARFQLFGDTMNTASRMESTGQAGKIQVSAETAGLLTASGKGRWLLKREQLVAVKGKGDMQVRHFFSFCFAFYMSWESKIHSFLLPDFLVRATAPNESCIA